MITKSHWQIPIFVSCKIIAFTFYVFEHWEKLISVLSVIYHKNKHQVINSSEWKKMQEIYIKLLQDMS